MTRVVYADLLFLINFSMDLLCLFVTSRIMHKKLRIIRGVLAAAVGGVYSVAILFVDMGAVVSVIVDLLVCSIICLVAFMGIGECGYVYFMTCAVFFGVSVCLGGLMTAMFSLLNRIDLPLDVIEDNGDGVSVWLFSILAMISGVVATVGGKMFKSVSSGTLMRAFIEYKGKKVMLIGMVDTGNLLREPISGRAVMLIDEAVARAILGDDCTAYAMDGDITRIVSEHSCHKVRLVPMTTASGGASLCAFVPDKITIELSDGKMKEIDVLFAPSRLSLGVEWKALGCEALMPASII